VTTTAGRNPYVFIVGCPRSGTTLLKRMVGAHPELAMPKRESHWIPRCFNERIGVTPEGMVTGDLIDWLLNDRRFPSMKIGREDLERLVNGEQPVSYASFVARLFDLYAERQGKPLAGDKTPSYARSIATIHPLWPRAQFVHIIRDGREVCLSMMSWSHADRGAGRFAPWAEDPVMTTACFWEWNILLGRDGGTALGTDLYREVRYEALVTLPADECAALCEFLHLRYSDSMLHFNEGRMRTEPGLDSKHAWLPPTPGLRDWKRQMPGDDVERFEAVAGHLLEELGYERLYPSPSIELRDRGKRIRARFSESALTQGWALPDRWLSG
jgi:hypothetical protein